MVNPIPPPPVSVQQAIGFAYPRFSGPGLMFDDEFEQLRRLIPRHGTYLEFGCWTGTTVMRLMEARDDIEATSVDIFYDWRQAVSYLVNRSHHLKHRLWWGETRTYHAQCAHHIYDVVMVDADHREEAAYRDLGYAFDLVKPGGIVLIHDYGSDYHRGVTNAANKYAEDNGLQVKRLVRTLAQVGVSL